MSDYTQGDWNHLARQVNSLAIDDIRICFSRQARTEYIPRWYVVVLEYQAAVYEINDYTPEGDAIQGNRDYSIMPPDWVYEEAQRAMAEHTKRYEELLNSMFLDTPEKRAEHLAKQLAGQSPDLKARESEVYSVFLNGWKARIKRLCANEVTHASSGFTGWVTIKNRRLNFEVNHNRVDVWFNGTFLQMYADRETIDEEVNKWIRKVTA
jgi:hypothetical protein